MVAEHRHHVDTGGEESLAEVEDVVGTTVHLAGTGEAGDKCDAVTHRGAQAAGGLQRGHQATRRSGSGSTRRAVPEARDTQLATADIAPVAASPNTTSRRARLRINDSLNPAASLKVLHR